MHEYVFLERVYASLPHDAADLSQKPQEKRDDGVGSQSHVPSGTVQSPRRGSRAGTVTACPYPGPIAADDRIGYLGFVGKGQSAGDQRLCIASSSMSLPVGCAAHGGGFTVYKSGFDVFG